jgi:hypothetical protein
MECTTKITITTTIKTINKKSGSFVKGVRIADAFSFFVKSLRKEIAIQSWSCPENSGLLKQLLC